MALFFRAAQSTDDFGNGNSVGFFRNRFEDLDEDLIRINSFGLSFEIQDNTMTQRRQENAANVFETYVVATFK
jgi:hypothetical protein